MLQGLQTTSTSVMRMGRPASFRDHASGVLVGRQSLRGAAVEAPRLEASGAFGQVVPCSVVAARTWGLLRWHFGLCASQRDLLEGVPQTTQGLRLTGCLRGVGGQWRGCPRW